MSEAMTYKLPPLPEPTALGMDFDKGWDGIRAYGYTEDDMQAYAIAAIEAQGVPDDADVWCEYVAEMVGAYISEPVGSEKVKAIAGIIRRRMPKRFFASTPPAPQAKPQPLSDEQRQDLASIRKAEQWMFLTDFPVPSDVYAAFAQAIDNLEAAHGIKGAKE